MSNLPHTIAQRSAPKPWPQAFAPLFMIFVRWPLLMVGYTLVALLFQGQGLDQVWQRAAVHNYVIVSLFADLGCLLLLSWLMRAEGGKISDLLNFQRERLGRDLLLGLGMFVIMAAAYYCAPLISALIVTGSADASAAWARGPFATPLWVHIWNMTVFPITTSLTEELVYRGYALPRIERLSGRAWVAVLLPALTFGLAHLTPPFLALDGVLIRFLTLALVGVVLELLYLRLRRLLPLIVGHYLIDLIFLGIFPFIFA
jgi:membrane protease YdiL (CAAX protease family)